MDRIPAIGFPVVTFLVAVLLFTALEAWLLHWVSGGKLKDSVNFLVKWTWLPWQLIWLLVFGDAWFEKIHLPEPHDFMLRKVQIVFGLIIVSHLFIFAGSILWRGTKSHRKVSAVVGMVSALFFPGMTLYTTQCDLSGDEPHYLLMAHSILHDGDLDLTNNYQNQDYEYFYHRGVLEPQGLEHVSEDGRYSHHPLGSVLLILPGFWLFGRLGASLTMALLAALALFLTLKAMEEAGSKGWPLLAVGAVGLFSSPILLFSGLIFPEVPTAFLLALGLWLFLRKRWVWLGLTFGLMIWMHNRNVLLVFPFFLAAAYEIWSVRKGWIRNLVKLYAGFKFPALALACYFFLIYGVWTPLGAHNESFNSLFRLERFWTGFFGLLLDQECGLWFHFPIFAMSVTGGVLLLRSRDPLRWVTVGTFVFYYLAMSFYENLGLTPAARYMVSVTPLLLVMMLPALEKMRRWDGWAFLTVFSVIVGVAVNWVLAVVPWMRYNKLDGENWILRIAGETLGLPLCAAEPSFNPPVVELKSYVLSAFWVVVTILMTAWFLREKKSVRMK